jgi:hypothetical protein
MSRNKTSRASPNFGISLFSVQFADSRNSYSVVDTQKKRIQHSPSEYDVAMDHQCILPFQLCLWFKLYFQS